MAYSTIPKGSLYMNTKLYTGTGSSQSITGVGFQPDFTWIKTRNDTQAHNLIDVVRGVTKTLECNEANAQFTDANGLTAFGSDGFTVGSSGGVNGSGDTLASWNWKETATAGFDIVSYTGTGSAKTVAHSLSAIPQMIIVKRYNDGTASWMVYHQNLGNTKYLSLDTTAAEDTLAVWNNTTPTSSVFSVGTDQRVNANGASYIAYCFAEKQGYSKFGSYNGNGNADGPFVYTGMKPAFVIYKAWAGPNSADNWEMVDNKRSPFNGIENVLYPNLANAEGTGVTTRMDMLSNGFKMRTSGSDYNGSGVSYIYMAFAENPFVATSGTSAIPVTAR
jgi:hypothetical protein